MDNNQPQTNQKNDQPSKPIVVDDKTEAAKKAEAAKAANANTPTVKPADAAKTGTA